MQITGCFVLKYEIYNNINCHFALVLLELVNKSQWNRKVMHALPSFSFSKGLPLVTGSHASTNTPYKASIVRS